MWALENSTPYAAERAWLRDKDGAHRWCVAVKATYQVDEAGAVRLAGEQVPVALLPEYTGEPGKSSLRYEADLTPDKPTTDVLLVGSARAPGGVPVPRFAVSIRVGPVHKELVVYGPRFYRSPGTISDPVNCVEQPLSYEWAYGGADFSDPDPRRQAMDARNPVGKGCVAVKERIVGRPAHALEYPTANPERDGPAGFGPVAGYWSPRRELAGTYDANWEKTRRPLLPADYDERHVLCSPPDQRPATPLRGGEPVELANLTKSGMLRFRLPSVELTFATWFGRRRVGHSGKLATILLEPDRGRLMMAWQTSLSVRTADLDYLDRTDIGEGK